MLLLFDIGNTHTHIGLTDERKIVARTEIPTHDWFSATGAAKIKRFVGRKKLKGAALCSVVPKATPAVRKTVKRFWKLDCFQLTHETCPIGINYPRPQTIGPDRLANAVAVQRRFGGPAVVVDFGTAVTFDVVDRQGCYAGGVIAPGLAAMTDYLHEKTALLPRITIREVNAVIGKNTAEAMLIGAVHGYRGLIRELIFELKKELKRPTLPVVATGGYAKLISSRLDEISAVEPDLTLAGLWLAWQATETAR